MGKIEVRGNAARTVDYDRMKVEINFHSVEMLPTAASEKSMKECEEFLKVLKGDGFDISKIAIKRDSVERDYYSNRDDEQRYRADRTLEIASAFNMNLINDLRDIINNMEYQIGFKVDFSLSNEEDIKNELLTEALKDAKKKAETMADAIGQRVIGLVSADKTAPKTEKDDFGGGFFVGCVCAQDEIPYEYSDELSASNTTLSEFIYTTWEIA